VPRRSMILPAARTAARPLRRLIQREVETRIGRALIAGEIQDGATIAVDADADELIVRWRQAAAEQTSAERETAAV
jgi:ATP-dependent Clp protease ATP-binding subunit ClpB